MFYPLNYGEMDICNGMAGALFYWLLSYPVGVSGFSCFFLNEAP